MAIDATKLRRGVRKLGEPPTDSNPELSAPTAVHTPSSGAPPLRGRAGVMAAGSLAANQLRPPPCTASRGDTAHTRRVPSNHLLSPLRKHRGR